MFGIGGSEIIVILVIALLFLGPEKLPDAAKSISKVVRDLKRSTRDIQETIEADEQIGGAIRDIKSAMRGDEPRPRPKPPRVPAALAAAAATPVPPPEPEVGPADAAAPDAAAPEGVVIKPAPGTIAKTGPAKSDG